MAPTSLMPVTLRSVRSLLGELGYSLFFDDGEDFVWKKTGPPPPGLEQVFEDWPTVVTHHYPSFKAEGHDTLVYDRSDVTDLVVEITGKDRTTGVRVVALLRSNAALACQKCGHPAQVKKYDSDLEGVTVKCTSSDCGHEEYRPIRS
jgi:hypothetical protein